MKGILVHNVSYTYPNGTKAISNISLRISPGEVVGILGANGAGKSTFMKLINGLIIPQDGSVFVDGKSTSESDLKILTKKVGVMFQNPEHQLFKNSVMEEIDYSLDNLDLSADGKDRYKQETIEDLELEGIIDKSPFNLSGGEKKKASMSTILCRHPDYLLFDEPTVGQDQKQRKILEKVINKAKSEGKTVIIISHDTEFTYTNVDRLVIFKNGQILADGKPNSILSNKHIIEKTNILKPQIMELMEILKKKWEQTKIGQDFPFKAEYIIDFSKLHDIILQKVSDQGGHQNEP